jgi:hypothetical protein
MDGDGTTGADILDQNIIRCIPRLELDRIRATQALLLNISIAGDDSGDGNVLIKPDDEAFDIYAISGKPTTKILDADESTGRDRSA